MASHNVPRKDPRLPAAPIDRVIEPVARFLHIQAASGVVLLLVTLAALVLANSAYAERFLAFWETSVGFQVGDFQLRHSLRHWINDGLMVIFFFVVGLEVKRELAIGELSSLRKAALPLTAAVGGMVVPAALYLALQWGRPGERGWGIPMATDIAFVVGAIALLGERAPRGLRILLLSLAIADDVGAILVIAVGYSDHINLSALFWGSAGIVIVLLFARIGVRSVPIYGVLGVLIWLAFHASGVHATIAGVILGLLTPVRPWVSENILARMVRDLESILERGSLQENPEERQLLKSVRKAAQETISPLERLEGELHPYVSYIIMPLFAFANAGVPLGTGAMFDSIAIAIVVGLFVGKPVGILLFSNVAVRLGWAALPAGVSWPILAGGGVLAGIGFTMSLFIAGLALEGDILDAAKIGILLASALSGVVGLSLLYWHTRKPA